MIVDVDQPVLMVAIGNGPSVGGGAELTPEADPEDGKVDVMISRAVGPLGRFGYAAQLAVGRHHERDDVIYLRGSTGSRSAARSSTAPPTARSTAPSANAPGTSSRRRTRWSSRPVPAAQQPAPPHRLHPRLEPAVHAELDQQAGHAAAYGPQADAEGAGDLLVLRAGGQLLQEEPAQVGPGLAEVQVGHGRGPVPHQLEQQDEGLDQRALADQDARLVGHAERLGQHGVGVPMTNSRVGRSAITRTCSPAWARARSASGASCSARTG